MAYHAPALLKDALDRLAKGDVRVVAGGTDVYPAQGTAPFDRDILDLTRITALQGISRGAEGWRIGATTTWTQIARADLPPAFDGLRAAAREVGSIQIQNAGTVAGNLCNASPAADGVPPLLTLEARVELTSSTGQRVLPLAEFLTGVRRTALQPGELVSALLLPNPPTHARGAFTKLGARRYLVISIAMVAVVVGCDARGRIDHACVAVGACSPVAQRLSRLEADLIGQRPQDVTVGQGHLAPLSPIDDIRGSAGYRLDAVAEQIIRAIRAAGGQ
ncbi:FAD binding domain-containing protein [Ruegeria pomeroyi]|uniref:Xanthine dehydrogenase family protein, medium subunit n=2 Tax=Ruegeria pomeroyi TaxID=89184 RepID=Q5LV71_RUEPO|nr:FAD binding domain-containing protein [Ruegeria pomeroyi]AAV94136.1 xanthine dehydrogenase family protein, medium subunit [Ruegeria pomeroyi DSS-3]NVK99330.1 FAD binding domain-containing protein [Ruegeria pomeroyi]NVL03850.1 FAD binding domain-containing protein [Ruegeria pomeroyi]QWV07716.1 FAD binding domain-containing protein [Ruegeria pomeroyi]